MKLWSHSPSPQGKAVDENGSQKGRLELSSYQCLQTIFTQRPRQRMGSFFLWIVSCGCLCCELARRKGVVETVKMCPCCLSRCGGLCEPESLSSTYCTSAERKTANATKEPYITEIREQHKMRSNHSAHLPGAQKWKATLLSDLDCALLGLRRLKNRECG